MAERTCGCGCHRGERDQHILHHCFIMCCPNPYVQPAPLRWPPLETPQFKMEGPIELKPYDLPKTFLLESVKKLPEGDNE